MPESVGALELDKVGIRPLEPSDAVYLQKWLTNPTVLEFYEGRDFQCSAETIQEHFYDADPWVERWAVTYGGFPIGYLQSYLVTEEMRREYRYDGKEQTVYAIDQFIGEPELWGKGIGKRFLCLIQSYLVEKKGAEVILLDPHADNPRALRAYQAVGFQIVKFLPAHELHEGEMRDCWLMAYYPDGRRLPGQIVPLAGARNVRELGGLQGRDGRHIQCGLFYRGGALDRLTAADCEYLYRLGIRTVLDLRSPDEIQRAPDALKGFQDVLVYSFPLLDGIRSSLNGSAFTLQLADMYRNLLDDLASQVMLLALFRKILEAVEEGGVLFHCTAGKDRTGVVAMLLLELFGVEDEEIIRDYALSEQLLEDSAEARDRLARERQIHLPLSVFRSQPENGEAFLNHLREKYGSARGFLQYIGMTDDEIEKLKQHMTEATK